MDEMTDTYGSNEFSNTVEGLPHATEKVVADALDTGDATARGYYVPQLRTEFVVTGQQPRYYRIGTSERDRTEVVGYEYAVEIGVDKSAVADDEQIYQFPELPAQDRESIRSAIGNTSLIHAPHYTSFSVVFAYEREELREDSMFVPDADDQYVEWEETLLEFTFDERRPVQISSVTVSAELVAESPAEFGELVRQERGVALDGLTSEQREIVSEAIEDEYLGCEPYSQSFADLLDRLSTSDGDFAPLARFDSVWYFTHVSQ